MLGTISPTVVDRAEGRMRARLLGRLPILFTGRTTRSRIAGETLLGSLSARETVMVETPARLATSRMRAPLPLILFFGVVVCSAGFAGAVPILRIMST